jgi:hypothetical protein
MLLALFTCSFFCYRLELRLQKMTKMNPDESLAKIKQTIKQNEECEDGSVCKQAAENNLIMCPIGSTCIFMTNDFVPYNLAIPR